MGKNYDDRPPAAIRLEEARIARGFRFAKDAAEYFGWIYSTYALHERGLRGIGRAAQKYAKAYRVSEAWLLTGEGHGPRGGTDVTVPESIRQKLVVLPQEEVDDLMENLDALATKRLEKMSRQ